MPYRYATSDPALVAMEVLSVANGVMGVSGVLLEKSTEARRRRVGILILLCSSCIHLYSALLYFLGEFLAGLPNVGTERIWLDFTLKFVLSNLPWVIMPPFVMAWSYWQLDCLPTKDHQT
jgi:emopamil binding protein